MQFYSHKKRIVASKRLQKTDNNIPDFLEKSGILFLQSNTALNLKLLPLKHI